MNWINSKSKMPKPLNDNIIYSETLMFKIKSGAEYKGWFRFDFAEWIVEGKTIWFSRSEVTHWMQINQD